MNLWKSLKSSKSFCLKNFLRVQASGFPLTRRSDAGLVNEVYGGKIKFEMILPHITFQILTIQPLPILRTPLSSLLCENIAVGNTSHITAEEMATYRTGYLTLNQTRKLVFLLDTDTSIATIPLIGVWIHLSDQLPALSSPLSSSSPSDELQTYIINLWKHPFCWAAAIRYLYQQGINERVFIAHETFLMV
jgi:hypothetical protein